MANVRVVEAAAYLGLSKSSLDKMRMGENGPTFFKLGRTVIYSTDDLDSWMASRRRTSTWHAANSNAAAALAA